MLSHNAQNISPSERTERFINNIRKLLFHLTADSSIDSAEAEKRLNGIPRGAGQIAGPIVFYSMSKTICRWTDITMGELTKELLIPPATANRLVTWWVDNGLAERLSDSNDKRVIRVRMTGNGRRLHEVIDDIAVMRIGALFSELTPEETDIFNLLFDKLASKFENIPTDSQPKLGSD
jgi:DNA-binding MarR family transcriptional regulator